MRALTTGLAASLESGVTNLAHVWRFTRADGAIFAFTDHDKPLQFDDLLCEPAVGLSAGAVEKSLGLGVDSASVTGSLVSNALTEVDLCRGLWDGAYVDLYRVDWQAPDERVHLFSGRIGEVRRGAQVFEAELRGLQAALNVPVGRVFSRFCDADVGDQRCGIDLDLPAFRGVGVVAAVLSDTVFTASGLGGFESGWFTRGRLVWDAGGGGEVATHSNGDAATIELLDPPGEVLAPGAAFVVQAGCDKRHATCRAKFGNVANFRGFPHMPGNDAMQAGPVVGEPLDGSSRFA